MLLTQTSSVILRPFAVIMGYIMQGIFWFLHLFMEYPRIGIAIILFTIIMYILMLPLTIKQQKFSKLSAKMNPELYSAADPDAYPVCSFPCDPQRSCLCSHGKGSIQ